MSRLLERIVDVVGRRGVTIWAAIMVVAVPLAAIGTAAADTDEPGFDPAGESFDIESRVDEVFDEPDIRSATFLVDRADGGNTLTSDVLGEIADRTDAVLSDPTHAEHLVTAFDFDMNIEVQGIASIAGDVAGRVTGPLGSADAVAIEHAVNDVLAPSSERAGLRVSLSESAAFDEQARWSSPAFVVHARYDVTSFDGGGSDDERDRLAERWLRDLQDDLGDGLVHARLVGVGIDPLLTGEEQVSAGGPFIFLAVALIVLLVAVLMGSYWAAVVAASAIGTSLVLYGSIVGLIGLSTGSSLIVFVVPMTLIAFGVDFFVHATDRVRERQHEHPDEDAASSYAGALRAVGPALSLAAATSIAAFMANGVSGIEAIVQFGLAASVGLAVSFVMLGIIAPRVLLTLEPTPRPKPVRPVARIGRWIGIVAMALVAGIVVSIAAVVATVGVAALFVFVAAFVVGPLAVARRRSSDDTIGDDDTTASSEPGTASLLTTAIVGCVRHRRVTVAAFTMFAIAGALGATRVEAAFEVSDFFSTDSEFIVGLDRNDDHFGNITGGPAYVYIEGDLTDPAHLRAMQDVVDDLQGSRASLARTAGSDLVLVPSALDVVSATMGSRAAIEQIAAAERVNVVDSDGDGWPDDADAIAAVYRSAWVNGVTGTGGTTVFTPEAARLAVTEVAEHQATRLQVIVTTFTDDDKILEARDELEQAASQLSTELGSGARIVGVSGESITGQESLAAFTRAMIVSLPVALLLTMLIVGLSLRSVRFSLVSLVPIIIVVVAVWGYMALRGFTINVVTATIAAIAVGVGVDFCTHFTVRYRDELDLDGDRVAAVRRTAAGTGGALAVSALTSVLGFGVMALAPTPIFSSFGELMAMMILLSAAAALFVLPSLLVLVTPTRTTSLTPEPTRIAERSEAIDVVGVGH